MGQTLKTEVESRTIGAARRRKVDGVVERALADHSAKECDVLTARNRLMAAGLIESAGYGKVDFAIPGLRAYLRAY